MCIGPAVQVLEYWTSQLQLLSQQQAAGQPVAGDLAKFAVLQPCADFIAAALKAVDAAKRAQLIKRRRAAAAAAAAAAGDLSGAAVPPAAAVEGGLVVPRQQEHRVLFLSFFKPI
jgi:hypothetical protein